MSLNFLQLNKFITSVGGPETVMVHISQLLSEKGHNVYNMGYTRNNQTAIKNAVSLGKENLRINSFFFNKKVVSEIIHFIQHSSIDVVICHNVYNHFPVWQLFREIKRKTAAKLVLYLHDHKVICPMRSNFRNNKSCELCAHRKFYYCLLNKCKSHSIILSAITAIDSYYNNFFHDAYKYCDVILSPSMYLRDRVARLGFKHPVNHLPLPYMINIKNRLASDIQSKSILFVGRLTEGKGVKFLIKLAKHIQDIQFDIIGDGPLKSVILNNAEHLKNVRYLGVKTKDELNEIYPKYSYFILPAFWSENYPVTILEAMSFGVPIIGSNRGGIIEQVGKSRGILIDSYNLEKTIRDVRKMFKIEIEEYKKMQKACITFVKNHSYTKFYENFMQLIDNE